MSGADAMRRVALLAATAVCGGCKGYDGAIYFESQHWGIGMRGSPEAAMPLQVDVGYDRDVIAFVPSDSADGEGGSLIAYNRTVAAEVLAEQGIPIRYDGIVVEAGMFAGDAARALVGCEECDDESDDATDAATDAAATEAKNVAKRIEAGFGKEKGIPFDAAYWMSRMSDVDLAGELFEKAQGTMTPDFQKLYRVSLESLSAGKAEREPKSDATAAPDAVPLKERAFRAAATNYVMTSDKLERSSREGELKRNIAAVLSEERSRAKRAKTAVGGGS